MKVNKTGSNITKINTTSHNEGNHVQNKGSSSFNSQLAKFSGDQQQEILQQMANKIIEQGERFSKKIDIAELKAYKKMVSEFLGEAVTNSSKFSKESFLDRRGRHRVYATVQKVNTKLEELTQEVLKNEKDNLILLNAIEDIRGMVLDIIL